MISFFVAGIPKPGGSKTATVIRRRDGSIVEKNGRPLVVTRDDAIGNAEWKSLVGYTARNAYRGDPLTGPLRLQIRFVMPRPRSHYGSGRNASVLRPDAPYFHTVKPDATKLLRSTEDALTGILWLDDNGVMPSVEKVYGTRPGAEITVVAAERAGIATPVPPSPLFQEGP